MGKNRITLQVGDKKQEFEINHAERILRMPNNGGWHLPEDSNYQMHQINGIVSKRNKGKTKISDSESDD